MLKYEIVNLPNLVWRNSCSEHFSIFLWEFSITTDFSDRLKEKSPPVQSGKL